MPRIIAGLEVYSVMEAIAAEEPPEGRWIAKPLFPTVGKTVVYGAPNDYKTFTMFDFALAYASKGEYFGSLPVDKSGRALFITDEGDIYDTGSRLRMLMRGHKDKDPSKVDFFCIHDSIYLNTQEGLGRFDQLLGDLKPGFVVLDPLRHFIPGVDENDATQMGKFCTCMNAMLRRHRFSLTLIHHANKKGGMRGSSALDGWADSELQFICTRNVQLEDMNEPRDVITVRQKKARNAKYAIDMLLVPVFDEKTETVYYSMMTGPVEGTDPKVIEAAQKVLSWHKACQCPLKHGFTTNDAAKESGVRHDKAKDGLAFLADRGLAIAKQVPCSTGNGRFRMVDGWQITPSTTDDTRAMLALSKRLAEISERMNERQQAEEFRNLEG